MGFIEDTFYKNVANELKGIRKNCEIFAKVAIAQEKERAELRKLNLIPFSTEDFLAFIADRDNTASKPDPEFITKNQKNDDIIAVDFDGTLCTNAWPKIGEPIWPVIEYVKRRQSKGARLILWTSRVDEPLREAIAWCKEKGILFNTVNCNLPEIVEEFGSDTRKIFANEYLDDRAISPEGIGSGTYCFG